MSIIGPVQSRCHEGSPVGKRSLRWEEFVEKVVLMRHFCIRDLSVFSRIKFIKY